MSSNAPVPGSAEGGGQDSAVSYVEPGEKIVHVSTPPIMPTSGKSLDEILDDLLDPKAIERQKKIALAYDEAVRGLLGADDYEEEAGRQFKKKSAWRKLAQRFNLSWFIVRNERWWEHDAREGVYHLIARVVIRVVAPWGQVVEAEGLCSTRESRFYTKGIACPKCGGPMWDNRSDGRGPEDYACKDKQGCGGKLMPGEWTPDDIEARPNGKMRMKADHDVEATAATRATNRGISDVIAAGEVSYEEVVHTGGRRDDSQASRRANAATLRGPAAQGGDPAAALLERKAFGKEWRDKTWHEVLEAGPRGWDFIEWVIGNTSRLAPAEIEIMRREIGARVQATTGVPPAMAQQQPPAAEEGDGEGELPAAHQTALTLIREYGRDMPAGVFWKYGSIETTDLKAWILKRWSDLQKPENMVYAVEVAAACQKATEQARRAAPASAGTAPEGSKPSTKPNGTARPPARSTTPPRAQGTQAPTLDRRKVSQAQLRRLFALASKHDLGEAGVRWLLAERYELGHPDEIERHQYDEICEAVQDSDVAEDYAKFIDAEIERHSQDVAREEGPVG